VATGTRATVAAAKAGITFSVHEYTHDPGSEAYGTEAATALGVDGGRVYKTLVAQLDDGRLAVAVVPVAGQLDLKALAAAAGAKRAAMAEPTVAERATGYVLGGISPLGQKKRLPTFVDDSALGHETVFVSAGRRGLEIELAPQDLVMLTAASTVALRRGENGRHG
jgi:Cys-tRNA(Pro)/Cys-tRNA(Cys) deacylase